MFFTRQFQASWVVGKWYILGVRELTDRGLGGLGGDRGDESRDAEDLENLAHLERHRFPYFGFLEKRSRWYFAWGTGDLGGRNPFVSFVWI